ncbi:hypothetical protein [Reinekea sp. G2M2-21]|uniref:hypothetical protein n=1 Tax=Reinekea sp. G2M2-21 TaxID=2788942 RepID=UPI0018AA2A30|nr:hypothetical protein [Reinekea sp. G2M2-21]
MSKVFPDHPKYQIQREWLLSDAIYATTQDGEQELICLNNMNNRWHHALEFCDGSPLGIQLAHKRNENSYCHIAVCKEDASRVTLWYFDENHYTMSIHYDTPMQALAEAIANGYWTVDSTALARVSATKAWKVNEAKAEVLRRFKAGNISLLELTNQFNAIDDEYGVAA